MPRVAKEDVNAIRHITYVSESIHQLGDDIYEDLMERENEEAKRKAQALIQILADLIQSLSDEI
tara:strand:- start:2093 stop:2284 length:192 start_codon:yes stop_codon:yes gene_type:complete